MDAEELPPDGFDAVRAEVKRIGEESGKSMAMLSREAGIGYSTFSAFVSGGYGGNNAAVAEKVQRWLGSREVQLRTKAALPSAPGFLPTPSAQAFTDVFSHAQHAPDLVVIAGGAGVGKTMACADYAERNPNVWLVTGEPCLARPIALLRELAEVMGVSDKPTRLSRAITHKLRGSRGLIIVDEAQHLSTMAMDQLRSVHDIAGVGLALVGNETVYSRLEGDSRQPQYAQIFSRIGMRLPRPKPLKKDVTVLLDAWKVTDQTQRGLLHAIAKKPGALRGLTKTLRIAVMHAASEGEPLAERHILAAWSRLSHTQISGEDA